MSSQHEEDEFDATLRGYLAAELDGQAGRAERAFRDHLRAARPAARPRTMRSNAWLIGATAAAVAASMAAMWAVPVTPPSGSGDDSSVVMKQPEPRAEIASKPEVTTPDGTPADTAMSGEAAGPRWEQVEQVVSSVTLDDGLVLLADDTPARLVRQVALERVEWVDERLGVRVQALLPREGARLIPVDTY